MNVKTTIPDLVQFDAASDGTLDAIYQLYYASKAAGYRASSWSSGHAANYSLRLIRDGSGMYVFSPPMQMNSEPTLIGIPIRIDPTVPSDTLELRDKDDRIVGKIYNIG